MSTFCIQNGEVVLPDRSIPDGTVLLKGGRIAYAGPARRGPRGGVEIDARGGYVTPGLIDVHIHGAGPVGWETCTDEDFRRIESVLLAHGILRFVPTMMAAEPVVRRMAKLLQTAGSNRAVGLYLEGPFIQREKRGGVQEEYIRPVDLAYLEELQRLAEGRIRMMTFAPELDGAEQLPAAMRKLGILPCVGHSLADAARAEEVCGRRGKLGCTHLFNAMSGLDHRQPGLAAFALNRDHVYVELNSDGTHVAPEMLCIARRAKWPDRLVLISDAVVSAGAEPGLYDYMDKKVRNTERGVYYEPEGTLIGSNILLDTGARRFMEFTGAPVHEAVRAASLNPARLLGLDRRTGSLEAGKTADMVIFSRRFDRVRVVFRDGKPVWPTNEESLGE